jgi:hypothetical protein
MLPDEFPAVSAAAIACFEKSKTQPLFLAAIAALQPGDEVRMPCCPEWQRVKEVRELSRGNFVCFAIDVEGGGGHGGEIPLGIRRAASAQR